MQGRFCFGLVPERTIGADCNPAAQATEVRILPDPYNFKCVHGAAVSISDCRSEDAGSIPVERVACSEMASRLTVNEVFQVRVLASESQMVELATHLSLKQKIPGSKPGLRMHSPMFHLPCGREGGQGDG
jgi:hypothetical protein